MTNAPVASAPVDQESSGYRSYVLGMLLLVYVLNFVDRQIIGILVEPIKAYFAAAGNPVTDTQMGLLGGLAFALFYTVLGIPLAWLADRFNRVWIITIALGVWSGFTVLCGMATTYWGLLIARIGVGAGEAGGSPPSQSLISDYFPPNKRASALSIWALGIPIGSAVGVILGAWVAKEYGWQMAFIVAGVPGLIVALIFKMTIKEPKRGRFDPPNAKPEMPTLKETFTAILGKPTFWIVAMGCAVASFVGYATFVWGAAYFVRNFDLAPTIGEETLIVSYFSAFIIGIAASIGTIIGGRLADRFGQKDIRAYVTIPAIALILAVPLNIWGLSVNDAFLAAAIVLIPTLLGSMWYGPLFGVVQNLVEPRMRAMAVAILFFIINLIGLGGGPTITGMLSDFFTTEFGPALGLRYALMAVCGFGILAGMIVWCARFTLARDMEAMKPQTT
jgi:MFS family permease